MTEFEQDVITRLTRIEDGVETLAAMGADHETRIRASESRQRYLTGAMSLLAPVLAFLGYHVSLH